MSLASPRLHIRAAVERDAPRLVAVRSAAGLDPTGSPEFVHHLGLPEGDDYFCLVVECDMKGIVAYCSAGGSRDDDRKSWAEIYELAVDPLWRDHESARAAARRLVDAVVARTREAQFGGLLAWVTRPERAAWSIRAGFADDGRERDGRAGRSRVAIVFAPTRFSR